MTTRHRKHLLLFPPALELRKRQIKLYDRATQDLLSVITFNILCPLYNINELHPKDLHPIGRKWKDRHSRIIDEIMNKSSYDIYCLQEFWCSCKDLECLYSKHLTPKHYKMYTLKRSLKWKEDGLSLVSNTKKFTLLHLGQWKCRRQTDRVIIVAILHHNMLHYNIMVANVHFSVFASGEDILKRNEECKDLLYLMESEEYWKHIWKNKPNNIVNIDLKIIAGDFNCSFSDIDCQRLIKHGYASAFHKRNDSKCKEFISHQFNQNIQVGCDFIFYKVQTQHFDIQLKECFLLPKGLPFQVCPYFVVYVYTYIFTIHSSFNV
ncbi:calcium-binding EF hand family protein [Reticulomyxa filosa]|uniref:Calcium-binding EF hand family protein n=1 Tax=Reticulomyxa filosa TaxID=46433 RepID=X6NTZ6_RETFI|nr:calcium-binding EF hand family protein [Reticulomyxa filosa]|eukprot:ETO28762.1 calcium-binding EF hand family protein [Reticulomyxa filosa]